MVLPLGEQFWDKIHRGHELSPLATFALVGTSSLVESLDSFKLAPLVYNTRAITGLWLVLRVWLGF